MTFHIIIKGKKPGKFGKTRSEQEENMRKEWGFTMSDEQLDKLKFIERKRKEKDGSTKNFVEGHNIDRAGTIKDGNQWMDMCCGPVSKYARGYDNIKWKT